MRKFCTENGTPIEIKDLVLGHLSKYETHAPHVRERIRDELLATLIHELVAAFPKMPNDVIHRLVPGNYTIEGGHDLT